MSEHMSPIPSRLYNAAVGGHVAGADQIIDDETGLTLDKVTGGALEEKTYTSGSDNGMGRVVLRKNLVEGINTLTQSMINKSNTIYVIQYDFTLGEDITVPANCVLEFDGGYISGNGTGKDTITGTNTGIKAELTYIFKNVLISGTVTNECLYADWFGVIRNSQYNASVNSNKINGYIVPSCENTKSRLVFAGDSNAVLYYFDAPIITDGSFDFVCDGQLIYVGQEVSNALTIGKDTNTGNSRIVGKYHQINLSYGTLVNYTKVDDEWVIPDNIGVKFINLYKSEVNIVRCKNFAYCIWFEAVDTGLVHNKVFLGDIGHYHYNGLSLVTKGNGWITENSFFGGQFQVQSASIMYNDNVGIIIDGSQSSHGVSQNVFYKTCLEGAGYGIIGRGGGNSENCFYNLRIEAIKKTVIKKITAHITYTSHTAAGGSFGNSFMTPAFYEDVYRHSLLKHTKASLLYDGTNYYSNFLCTRINQGAPRDVTKKFNFTDNAIGKIVDTAVCRHFILRSNLVTRFFAVPVDIQTMKTIPISENDLVDGWSYYNGYAKPDVDSDIVNVSLSDKYQYVFIGASSRIALSAWLTNLDILAAYNIPLLGDESLSFDVVPTTNTNVDVGDMAMYNGKPLWWAGTAWVDATGATV